MMALSKNLSDADADVVISVSDGKITNVKEEAE